MGKRLPKVRARKVLFSKENKQEASLSDSSAFGQQNSLDLREPIPSVPIHLSSTAEELVEALDLLSTLTA